jgi:penicillin-binding protein 1C
MPALAKPGSRALAFQPDGPGFVRLTVLDAAGATDSVLIRLQQ